MPTEADALRAELERARERVAIWRTFAGAVQGHLTNMVNAAEASAPYGEIVGSGRKALEHLAKARERDGY